MFTTYFSSDQLFVLGLIVLLHVSSIYFFTIRSNVKWALLLLFIGAFVSRIFMIMLDDFFHPWDEQFHALVAKHLSENPILPLLYKTPFWEYDKNDWVFNHVWLHKQPFFLWQIALSIKVFGLSVWAVRLPSALMSLCMVFLIYRMGKITVNSTVGFISAFLFATNNYFLELITGYYSTDHNDVAFIFYVTLSIWAFVELEYTSNKKYIYLIGLFAGIAILNKWMVGLIVYSGWGLSIILFKNSSFKEKLIELKSSLLAFFITLLVFFPWQLYILYQYPELSRFEYSMSSMHLFHPIEGHSGSWTFHFEALIEQLGLISVMLLPIAFYFLYKKMENIKIRIAFFAIIIITYSFFTIAATKMPAFCNIVAPIIFLAFGTFYFVSYSFLQLRINEKRLRALAFFALLILFFLNINIEKIQEYHTRWNKSKDSWYRDRKIKSANIAKSVAGLYPKGKTVFLNCNEMEYISIMFFDEYTAYRDKPTFEMYDSLKKQNLTIVYLDDYSEVPSFIKKDTSVKIIPAYDKRELKRFKTAIKINNNYICSDPRFDNILFANRHEAKEWEQFTFIELEDNYCVIKDYKDNYLSSELAVDGKILSNRVAAGSWEFFRFEKIAENKIAIKAYNGKYLSLDKISNSIFASANSISENEIFELISQ